MNNERRISGPGSDNTPIAASHVGNTRSIPRLDWSTTVDILDYCEVRREYIYQKCSICVILSFLLWLVYLHFSKGYQSVWAIELLRFLAWLSIAWIAVSAWYWERYRREMVYEIREFRLLSVRGVFLKTVNTAPLTPYWCFEMRQSLFDWLFDVWRIQLFGDFVRDDTIHLIPALSYSDAFKLFEMLSSEVDRQIGVAGGAVALEEQIGVTKEDTST